MRSDHLPFPMPDRPYSLVQEWKNLTFMHWEVDPEKLARYIPEGLEMDLFEGKAFIGTIPFMMTNVRPRLAFTMPGISTFPEVLSVFECCFFRRLILVGFPLIALDFLLRFSSTSLLGCYIFDRAIIISVAFFHIIIRFWIFCKCPATISIESLKSNTSWLFLANLLALRIAYFPLISEILLITVLDP